MTAIPDKTAADPQQIIAELERKLDERTSERDEALERQTATADILQVIARSPSDVQPVFDAVAERAMSLLDCWSVLVTRFDGEHVHFGAARGALPDTEKFVRQRYPMRPNRETSLLGRSLLERTVVSSTDVQAEADPQLREYARTLSTAQDRAASLRLHRTVPAVEGGSTAFRPARWFTMTATG